MINGKTQRSVGGLAGAACAALWLLTMLVAAPIAAAQNGWPPAVPLKVTTTEEVGLLPPSLTAESLGKGQWKCTFNFRAPAGAKSVALAGTFNGWNSAALPMSGPDTDGNWSVSLQLGAGEYEYKFVVDGGTWVRDPLNPVGAPDSFGGENAVLRIGKLANLQKSEATAGDGRIEPIGLEHRPERPTYFQPLAGERALVRLRTLSHDVQRVWVAVRGGAMTEMHLAMESPLFATYEAEIVIPAARNGSNVRSVDYTFVLQDGAERVSSPDSFSRSFTTGEIFTTPDWARNAVWYQIMVDRFRNGSAENDPPNARPWTSEWFTPAAWEGADGQTFYKWYVYFRLYGGDFQGLEEKLPYLKELGVNALYLNPIFKAESHHKYDTTNYVHVDDHFGVKGDYEAVAAKEDLLDPRTWQWTQSDRLFLQFLRRAKSMGFRVILDGVFNHVGKPHPAFQDVMKHGRASRFADWFDVTSWEPLKYNGWAGVDSLPAFKKSPEGLYSASAKQHIFNVTRRWMDPDGDGDPSDGIDGWRLDVPNEIPAPFWVEWRALVKSINPDAYITGEIWDRAEVWLDGQRFDAVMNYPFARAAVAWIFDRKKKISASEIDRRLAELRLAYPAPATYVMQNLMGSHDTDRVVSMALNPDRTYDSENRVQDNGPKYDNSKPPAECYAKARLAALLQMTYLGAPMIYYGDEVGMWGADDPTCRKPMLWKDLEPYDKPDENAVMEDHLAFHRRIIALRNAHPALRTGSFETLLTDDKTDLWAFMRGAENEQLVVVLNASAQPRDVIVPLPPGAPKTWQQVFGAADGDGARISGEGGKLAVRGVGAHSGAVFHARLK